MDEGAVLSLPEWVVLAVIDEGATHGFAVAALTAPDGELGRVWQISRPVIYRAMGRLVDLDLIAAEGTESGRGPQRTIYAATPEGHAMARRWLQTPVEHIREVRSQLLLKMAMLERRGLSSKNLIRRQRQTLAPIAQAVTSDPATAQGFDRTLLAWRRATATATIGFLDDMSAQ